MSDDVHYARKWAALNKAIVTDVLKTLSLLRPNTTLLYSGVHADVETYPHVTLDVSFREMARFSVTKNDLVQIAAGINKLSETEPWLESTWVYVGSEMMRREATDQSDPMRWPFTSVRLTFKPTLAAAS